MPEQNFQINVLPPVAFPQEKIKKFGLHISYLYRLTAPLPEIRNSGVNYWRHLAEKPETFTVFRFGSLSPEIREQVLRDFKVSLFVATRYITPLGNFARLEEAERSPCAGNGAGGRQTTGMGVSLPMPCGKGRLSGRVMFRDCFRRNWMNCRRLSALYGILSRAQKIIAIATFAGRIFPIPFHPVKH